MKKLMTLILPLFLFTATFIACSNNTGLEAKYEVDAKQSSPSYNKDLKVEIEIDNETPVDQAEKAVDIHYVAEKYFAKNYRMGNGYLNQISADIGAKQLRKVSTDSNDTDLELMYSVHKVKQGGLLYIFYRCRYEDQNQMYTWFYVTKKLSIKDFAAITQGTTIKDVIKIDPAAQIFENIFRSDTDALESEYETFVSYHYLDDGILQIVYKYLNGKFTVGGQYLFNNFRMEDVSSGSLKEYDCRVLPMDMIK